MKKPYTHQDYVKQTVLTDNVFSFVSFYFSTHKRQMKYQNQSNLIKYGDPDKYHYQFYWDQAKAFYEAAKVLPIESAPLAAYYAMLNAAKSYISHSSGKINSRRFRNGTCGSSIHEFTIAFQLTHRQCSIA